MKKSKNTRIKKETNTKIKGVKNSEIRKNGRNQNTNGK